jgi:hypothetical protein
MDREQIRQIRARLEVTPGLDTTARERFPRFADVLSETQPSLDRAPIWPKHRTLADQRELLAQAICTVFDVWDSCRRDRAALRALLAAIDELEATVTVAESEIAELEAARDRVLALHKKQYAGPFQSTPAGPRYWCEECNVTWPCETVRTVTP